MSLMKYAVYLGVILGIAFFFEQIMVFMYDLTLQCAAGELASYVILAVIWVFIYIIMRAYFDKKVHPQSSKFALWASVAHIGVSLAVFFSNTDPLLLLIFLILPAIWWMMRYKPSRTPKVRFSANPIHLEFIDARGGVCVLRSGLPRLTLLKFFTLYPPLAMRELLMFFNHRQMECSLELQRTAQGLNYCLALITQGHNYDQAFEECYRQANDLRQFLKKQRVRFRDIGDYLNAQLAFYKPYFCETAFSLDHRGHPRQFPTVTALDGEVVIEEDFSERCFAIHALRPEFTPNDLYAFLEKQEEEFFLQFHMRPLTDMEVELLEIECHEGYRDSLQRLSEEVQNDGLFAVGNLFERTGEASMKNFEPLLDREELKRFKKIKKQMRDIEDGKRLGFWEFEFRVLGSSILAQSIRVKVGGELELLPPHALRMLSSRLSSGFSQVVNSKKVERALPYQRQAARGITANQTALEEESADQAASEPAPSTAQ